MGSNPLSSGRSKPRLDEVGDIHGHLFNLRVVELLNITKIAHVALREEVDCDALAAEATAASDSVDVILSREAP